MAEHPTVNQALKAASQELAAAGCDTPQLDAEVLLAHALDHNRSWLYTHPSHSIPPDQSNAYQSLLHQRMARQPVAYLLGHKEFFGLEFSVSPAVLIPRPETELLVEKALELAQTRVLPLSIADIGTGSGAVAVSLASRLDRARIVATDISGAALDVARHNAAQHQVTHKIDFVQADILPPCSVQFDLIVANLPYIDPSDLLTAQPEVAEWEPRLALDGGQEGLLLIGRILQAAAQYLRSGGTVILEIGADQGQAALDLAKTWLPRADAQILQDYAGLDRLLIAHRAILE